MGPRLLSQEYTVPRQSESTLTAVKQAVDIVALVGEYLPLHRAGSKYKALCPFHDDHNPSMEVNPDRQSYKCWVCGAGGDVFDFVVAYERVEFPEALRMLADRAGVTLEAPSPADRGDRSASAGPGRAELQNALAWAEKLYADSLTRSAEVLAYVADRGIRPESIARFQLGHAPDRRDWLQNHARKAGIRLEALVGSGLVSRNDETEITNDRFRGRLIFPIHDLLGRIIGFGGRILPAAQRAMEEQGRGVAKYLNSPETALFQKRRQLYAADLARNPARDAGWVGVVEGYTDVIAAHQVGIENVVGTLGTALGDDHVNQLRRLADRVVLVFDGDEAGQKAADRSLELFLGHALDVRVITLPDGLDPCDFLLTRGAGAFQSLVDTAVDPLDFAIQRATARFDLDSAEGTRLAAEWVLSVLSRVPASHRAGLELKVAKALDTLSRRLRIPVSELKAVLRRQRLDNRQAPARPAAAVPEAAPTRDDEARALVVPSRLNDLDSLDRELVQLALNEPGLVSSLRTQVPADSLREPVLRLILQACYELDAEGEPAAFERLSLRLDDPAVRSLAAGLLLPLDPAPMRAGTQPAPPEVRLNGLLQGLVEREWRQRLRDLEAAKADVDPALHPDDYRTLQREYLKVLNQRPVPTRKATTV